MGGLPACIGGFGSSRSRALIRGLFAAMAIAAISAPTPMVGKPKAMASTSLCTPGEAVLFSCPIGNKLVSVCGQSPGRSIYRFGRPGRIELQATNLRRASTGFSGGGEGQIYFERKSYRYILFDKTVRTGFGPDGRHDPQFSSGLLVMRSGRLVSSGSCGGSGEAIGSAAVADYMPEGDYVPH